MATKGGDAMTAHCFGGGWTQIKLDVLEKYLSSYVTALKNKPFKLLYIDAFAGTGEVTTKSGPGDPIDGSAKIALGTSGFDAYLFVERHAGRFDALNRLREAQPPERQERITVHCGDANVSLPALLPRFDRTRWRAVAFLDPYGLGVDWSTLEWLAATKAVDLWFLFSLSGLYRQAARDLRAVDATKEADIDRALGSPDWRNFYGEPRIVDMFDPDRQVRNADVDALEAFVTERLRSIFPKVLEPLRLPREGAPLFSLFFAIANDDPQAIGLATRIAGHILNRAQ